MTANTVMWATPFIQSKLPLKFKRLLFLFEARHANHNFNRTQKSQFQSCAIKTQSHTRQSLLPTFAICNIQSLLLYTITISYSKSTLLVHLLKHQVPFDLHLRPHSICPEKQLGKCSWWWWGHLFLPVHLGRRQSLHSPHRHCSSD